MRPNKLPGESRQVVRAELRRVYTAETKQAYDVPRKVRRRIGRKLANQHWRQEYAYQKEKANEN